MINFFERIEIRKQAFESKTVVEQLQKSYMMALNDAADEIERILRSETSPFDKELALHELIINIRKHENRKVVNS